MTHANRRREYAANVATYLASGCCYLCATRAAWVQAGTYPTTTPCPDCAGVVAAYPVAHVRGWRLLSPLGKVARKRSARTTEGRPDRRREVRRVPSDPGTPTRTLSATSGVAR